MNTPLTSLGGNCGEGTGIGTGCFTTYAAAETRLDWTVGSTSVIIVGPCISMLLNIL